MKKIKAVIFDMDGVLVNTEPLHYEMWKETLHRRGVELEYEIYKDCIGSTNGYLMELVLKNYGVDFRQDEAIFEECLAVEREMIIKEGMPKMTGVIEMLERMKDAGYVLAIASSSPIEFIEYAMDYIGARDYFALLSSGDRIAHPKPAPDIYIRAAEKLGVAPSECVILEDSANGCRAAKAAGAVCIGLFNPDSGEQDLEAAESIISSLEEFTPEFIETVYRNAIQGI